MEDAAIVALYLARSEDAISQTDVKYGRYCHKIAHNILQNQEDAQECVNDTYLGAWNAIPPHKPKALSTFLGKLTRRISIDCWRRKSAGKRGGGELVLTLEELRECVADAQDLDQKIQQRELARALDRFLADLGRMDRDLFVARYWFVTPVKELAEKFGISESKAKMRLLRIRKKLQDFLAKEGYL